ncbi:hypothetical protein MHZ95_17350 [Sporosarcina sp. ACRSM]|uniref:hypothetical protein n=1 Tax=Sporosarcina sp. ACRSM TaxID=2918216 RepID=UPI001EF5FEE9|nr:hypothetical protein [Sporosarcina sp. ACRSM]MCG7337029.1 hypothetical protein [Sporosarcina sp. ACRSM]
MLFVMTSLILFSIPGIMVIWSAIDVKSGKKEKIQWKLPAVLLLLLVGIGVTIQMYLRHSYGFSLFQTNVENWIGMAITVLLSGIILLINVMITKTMGKNLPKSIHNPKNVNLFVICLAVYLLIVLFVAEPTGKKIAFSVSIHQAMEAASTANMGDFPIVLVNSEKECLRNNTSCRDTPYSNQFFIQNHSDKTQNVQAAIRALDRNQRELKVIDSKMMTLKPSELHLLETSETNEDASLWKQYSFQTDDWIASYQHKIRLLDSD